MHRREDALRYHREGRPGKIELAWTKPVASQLDLSLAYSPGVADPCREIFADPDQVDTYTARRNLVAVVTNGTAVLGLGDIGPLAAKPVMEGKAVLFKKFANIDVFDIELDEKDADRLVDIIAALEPGFGGINLEDIKAPECFEIERVLIEQCAIPVFHDDQHGTAIVTAAGLLNALDIQGKSIESAKVVCLGAGAAAIACMRLLVSLGADRRNLYMVDRRGVIYPGREGLNEFKEEFANAAGARTLADAVAGADVFIGLSGADLLSPDMLMSMAPRPVIFACSNPDPEIRPEIAKSLRDDLVIATGRSDYPNQVNNVLGFPFIFRGAMDVRAATINEPMKVAAVHALRALAREPVPEAVLRACLVDELEFGPDYIIPKPVDERLLGTVSAAVAQAAVESGVAQLPYPSHYPLRTVADVI